MTRSLPLTTLEGNESNLTGLLLDNISLFTLLREIQLVFVSRLRLEVRTSDHEHRHVRLFQMNSQNTTEQLSTAGKLYIYFLEVYRSSLCGVAG
jgi:hypothetical protein